MRRASLLRCRLVVAGALAFRSVVMLGLFGTVLPRDAAAESYAKWEPLAQRLGRLAASRSISGARVAYAVTELGSGEVVAQQAGDETVPIASCAKLVTTATALTVLGPERRIETALYGKLRADGVIEGHLYLKGYGDPSLRQEDLWQLARRLRRLGVKRVTGALVIDESYFDGHRLPPLFETRDDNAYYRAATGALSLHENIVVIEVRPAMEAGQPARVLMMPESPYLRLHAEVQTVARRRRPKIEVEMETQPEHENVEVTGAIRVGSHSLWIKKRIDDPGRYTGWAMLSMLALDGIRVGTPRVVRGRVPQRAQRLVRHLSRPLGDLIRRMNKASSNVYAEQLIKILGAETAGPPGTHAHGLEAVRDWLAGIGIAPKSYQLANGSGLYEAAFFSPLQLVQVLRTLARDFRYGAEVASSLAVSGEDGTLRRRFAGSGAERYVRAKTGTLASVVSLSGYAGSPGQDQLLVFSILINDLKPSQIRRARRVADKMAAALVQSLKQ